MCFGPVRKGASYWGLIQVKAGDNDIKEDQLEDFKKDLMSWLKNYNDNNVKEPELANGLTVNNKRCSLYSIDLYNWRANNPSPE